MTDKSLLPQPPNVVVSIVEEIYERMARLWFEGKFFEGIDRIPIEMRPKTFPRATRCCIYRDRALIRYRIMAALGLRIEDEVDELRTLRSYAEEALQRTIPQIQKPVLTVLADACNRCTKQQFLVTDACQSCIAKVCSSTCPKAAIDHHREDGRATIDPQKCVRCGQCVKVCPFHAIIDIKIPCVQVCPVGAITQHPDGRKIFDFQKCIYCGNCQKACPFGSVMPRSMMLDVLKLLQKPSSPVIALIAPAIVGHFGPSMSLPCIIGSIKRLGFAEVIEVSLGADQTAMEEAREFQERMHAFAEKKPKAMPFMTTSCCPAYVHAIKRHIPEIEDAVSATPTPMFFTAEMARKKFPGCVTVFIGPCDAKLAEAIDCPHTDLALTFTEIYAIIRGCGIKLEEVKDDEGKTAATGLMTGRGFAITGGVSTAVAAFSGPTPEVPISPVIIDGLNPASVKKLRSFAKKPPPGNLVEVMTCEGGCVAGPGASITPNIATARVKMVTAKSAQHPAATKVTIKPVIIRGDTVITPEGK